jgi:hypothetical protein
MVKSSLSGPKPFGTLSQLRKHFPNYVTRKMTEMFTADEKAINLSFLQDDRANKREQKPGCFPEVHDSHTSCLSG